VATGSRRPALASSDPAGPASRRSTRPRRWARNRPTPVRWRPRRSRRRAPAGPRTRRARARSRRAAPPPPPTGSATATDEPDITTKRRSPACSPGAAPADLDGKPARHHPRDRVEVQGCDLFEFRGDKLARSARPNRQIRSQPTPVPARPPGPSASPLILVNGNVTRPSRASVPACHAWLGRNVVAGSGCRRQTGHLATRVSRSKHGSEHQIRDLVPLTGANAAAAGHPRRRSAKGCSGPSDLVVGIQVTSPRKSTMKPTAALG
jgi:hypothetical protein